ncbi:pfkB family carbohydrate kinase-like protein [Elsinoe fawcettii]|nr:pfkB family carbohydrate kinase-like protein [Elsinoe fawcettii]
MDFTTLGMFIIDDIYPPPSAHDQKPFLGIPGGAGTYCAVGARILSPPPSSKAVGWVVDCGPDFPADLRTTIDSWYTGALMRFRDGPTTKGWNGYSANERRDFKYLTPKIRIAEDDLTPELLASSSFHMVCAPSRAIDLVRGITARRKQVHPNLEPPKFIFEPNPDWAIPDALEDTLETINFVDVLSPNHSELAHLFNRGDEVHQGGFNATVVEECADQMIEYASTRGRALCVVVRAGKEGCLLATNIPHVANAWFPPYHTDQEKVVDPTGGGNGFLGGFAVGLVRTGSVPQAIAWGTVAASFCIEQVGIPALGFQTDGQETWNSVIPQQRLEEWKDRVNLSG